MPSSRSAMVSVYRLASGRFREGYGPGPTGRLYAIETRARTHRPTGGRAYGYRENKVDKDEAAIVRQIFERERLRAMQARATEQPRELQELGARIERLRERLKHGDPDMAADEIQAAIDRAEAKRRELQAQQPEALQSAKVLSMLPKAAALYRRQIAQGLNGDAHQALKARIILRELFGGKIRLVPDELGGLMAHWELNQAALLKAVGTDGSGGVIRDNRHAHREVFFDSKIGK